MIDSYILIASSQVFTRSSASALFLSGTLPLSCLLRVSNRAAARALRSITFWSFSCVDSRSDNSLLKRSTCFQYNSFSSSNALSNESSVLSIRCHIFSPWSMYALLAFSYCSLYRASAACWYPRSFSSVITALDSLPCAMTIQSYSEEY